MLIRTKLSPGFTLLEVLVVIAITLILSTISVTALNEFGNRLNHKEAAQVVLGALTEAHARTLASQDDTTYSVHFETTEVVVFKGTSYTAGDPENDTYRLPSKASITNVGLGGDDKVTFERLSGSATPSGTITVSHVNDATKTKVITIYESGLIEITN